MTLLKTQKYMKAMLLTDIGGRDKLKLFIVDKPEPKKDESLVRVLYCGINHLDLLIRQGKRLGPKKFPHILGSEIVGEVESTGEKVVVYPWIFCGVCKQCKSGFENICDNGGTIGRTSLGGYAEFVSVPKRNLIKIPPGIKLADVAALALAGTTAYHLIERAKVKNRSKVLVTGATGGVGTIVVQILKSKNCQIITATSHKNKVPLLQKIGLERVVLVDNMTDDIKKIHPEGIDYVVDIVGGSVWSDALTTLSKNGTLVFCATSKDEPGTINVGAVFPKQLNILGSSGGSVKDLKSVMDLLKKGILKPVIDSIYDLKDVAKAHQKMEDQKIFGKILLKI